jgi:hypothetical protein
MRLFNRIRDEKHYKTETESNAGECCQTRFLTRVTYSLNPCMPVTSRSLRGERPMECDAELRIVLERVVALVPNSAPEATIRGVCPRRKLISRRTNATSVEFSSESSHLKRGKPI